MYILIVARGVPTKKHPLNGIFEFDQAKALVNNRHKVVYLSLDFRSFRKKRSLGLRRYSRNGITIFNLSLPLGPVHYKIFNVLGRFAIKFVFNKIIKTEGPPDVIHAHFTVYSAISAVLKKKYSIPFIITEHSSLINKNTLNQSDQYLATVSYPYADKVISVSSALAKKIKEHFNIESTVIPNIVDTSRFSFISNATLNPFTFISVGNLKTIKGHDILIKAFSKINNSDKRLIIVGDGPAKKELSQLINFLKLENKVFLVGSKTREEINTLFERSHIFALASRGETFGVSYIEAMSSGLPVIATKCGGPEDFVDSKNGLLVEVDNIEEFSQAMEYMYSSYDDYNRKEISNFSRKNFDSGKVADALESVYCCALKNRKTYESTERN